MIGICYGQKRTRSCRKGLLRLPNDLGEYLLACVQIPLCPDWRRDNSPQLKLGASQFDRTPNGDRP